MPYQNLTCRKLSQNFVLLTGSLVMLSLSFSAHAQDAGTTAPTEPEQPTQPTEFTAQATVPTAEVECTGGQDEDGDGLADCSDADCFDAPTCHAGGQSENTPAHCGDWIDNDGDGGIDCEDPECETLQVCQGSWRDQSVEGSTAAPQDDDLPELGEGMSVEDLIGRGGDANGERSDELCSDGADNDHDGRTDCQDFGCRFDPQVTVCSGTPGVRFSVVAGVGARITWNYTNPTSEFGGNYTTNTPDAGFTLLQLRALGPIPFIRNSFFLVNVRAEDRVRLTFVNFTIPLSNNGHYVSLNSGAGSLSPLNIISAARLTLLERPFYLLRPFEQGNGAQVEVGGPVDDLGQHRFRAFASGGAGEFNGNVGGRFFRSDDRNFAYTLGGQYQINMVGHYDRFDSDFIYNPVPVALAFLVGAKFDQRPNERQVVAHALGVFRYSNFVVRAEAFGRYVLDYNAIQAAYNLQVSALLVPRTFMLAADFGSLHQLQDYNSVPTGVESIPEELQFRVALHWFYFRDVAVLTALYRESRREHDPTNPLQPDIEREVRLESRFRF